MKKENWIIAGIIAVLVIILLWFFSSKTKCAKGTRDYVELLQVKTTDLPFPVPRDSKFSFLLKYYDQRDNCITQVAGGSLDNILNTAEMRHERDRLNNIQLNCVYTQSKRY